MLTLKHQTLPFFLKFCYLEKPFYDCCIKNNNDNNINNNNDDKTIMMMVI